MGDDTASVRFVAAAALAVALTAWGLDRSRDVSTGDARPTAGAPGAQSELIAPDAAPRGLTALPAALPLRALGPSDSGPWTRSHSMGRRSAVRPRRAASA